MKIVLMVLLLCLPLLSVSQDSLVKNMQDRVQYVAQQMQHELDLSRQQTVALKTLIHERMTAQQDLKKNKKADFVVVNKVTLKKMEAILYPQQYAKYLKLKKKKQEHKNAYLKKHPNYKFSDEDKALSF